MTKINSLLGIFVHIFCISKEASLVSRLICIAFKSWISSIVFWMLNVLVSCKYCDSNLIVNLAGLWPGAFCQFSYRSDGRICCMYFHETT